MKEMKYAEILKANKALGEASAGGRTYRIAVMSNVTVNQLKEVLEYSLRLHGINAVAEFGDYDNIVQDSTKFKDADLVVIFWEAANLVGGVNYKAGLMDGREIEELLERVRGEMDMVFRNLEGASLVLMNMFSPMLFNGWSLRRNNFSSICATLNEYADRKKPANTLLVDIENIIAKISVAKAFDSRFFYSSKAPYTIDFFKEYAVYVRPAALSANGLAKKALVFDCDNTLWKGILGEDEIDNLVMSSQTHEGSIFEEVQSLALELAKGGVLLGLCSKNNPDEVDEVLSKHPDMKIRNGDIVIKKVNWDDKVSNLKAIATELNIGLDSIVFVDDSSFEINLVRENLPQVTVLQVPARLSDYPALMREHAGLFFNLSRTSEDAKKTEMYKVQALREGERENFHTMEEYLRSLEIRIFIHIDPTALAPRIAQLTQKTNQFNLTTKRYTEADIEGFVKSQTHTVVGFGVSDKFGDSGIVGAVIISFSENKAEVDTFLMSCRVIGRNVELAVFDWVLGYIKRRNINTVSAEYRRTQKNAQVMHFYGKLGFKVLENTETVKRYAADIGALTKNHLDYLEVVSA